MTCHGVLTKYHPGGILCINIKLSNLTWRGGGGGWGWGRGLRENDPLRSISKLAEKTKTSGKIASPQSASHNYFVKLPTQNSANHLIVQPEFLVFPCEC